MFPSPSVVVHRFIVVRWVEILKATLPCELVVECPVPVEKQIDLFPFLELGVELLYALVVQEVVLTPVWTCLVVGIEMVLYLFVELVDAVSSRQERNLQSGNNERERK